MNYVQNIIYTIINVNIFPCHSSNCLLYFIIICRNIGGDKPSPVLDMFQILNLNKRVDAAEQGMEKIASLVEETVRNVERNNTGRINFTNSWCYCNITILRTHRSKYCTLFFDSTGKVHHIF